MLLLLLFGRRHQISVFCILDAVDLCELDKCAKYEADVCALDGQQPGDGAKYTPGEKRKMSTDNTGRSKYAYIK